MRFCRFIAFPASLLILSLMHGSDGLILLNPSLRCFENVIQLQAFWIAADSENVGALSGCLAPIDFDDLLCALISVSCLAPFLPCVLQPITLNKICTGSMLSWLEPSSASQLRARASSASQLSLASLLSSLNPMAASRHLAASNPGLPLPGSFSRLHARAVGYPPSTESNARGTFPCALLQQSHQSRPRMAHWQVDLLQGPPARPARAGPCPCTWQPQGSQVM